MDNKVSNVHYELIDSLTKGFKEVHVTFLLNGKKSSYFIFVKEKPKTNYINEAKKIFKKDLESGEVIKACHNSKNTISHSFAIPVFCILGAIALILGGLLTWKLLTPASGGGDTPVVDESVSTLTYDYSPYRKCNSPTIFFEHENPEDNKEDEPPFVGDVYVQWNKDDPSTKVKVEAGTKKVDFDYKGKYPNAGPREFTIVISGDVRTFSTVSFDLVEDDGNSYFTSINIGQSVTTILAGAFNGVNYLNSVHIAGNVSKIKQEAFCGCTNLQYVDFSTVDETDHLDIAYGCFMACNNLKIVHLPKRLTYMGPLKLCRSLEELTIPEDNEYFSALYKNKEGKMVESGMLVTKKEVKCPHFDEEEKYDDTDYKKDTVIASTVHPHMYEGLKAINSLSGADINQLVIPSTVESINSHELAISHIDSICVEQGNRHYPDLYQTVTGGGEYMSALVLAELNEDNDLSIIKVAKDATRIVESGDIYIDGEPTSYPITDFAYGAINNSDITSLDLPSTLKTFNFDAFYDNPFLENNKLNVNPFFDDLTDLTMRSIDPPKYVPNEKAEGTHHITDLIDNNRTDRINIHVSDLATQNYSLHIEEDGYDRVMGYWNYNTFYCEQSSKDPEFEPKDIRFQYGVIDSEILSSREEARQWVEEHYKSSGSDFFVYTKWDFTPLAGLQSIDSGVMDRFNSFLIRFSDKLRNTLPVAYSLGKPASINPNPITSNQSFKPIQVSALNSGNFEEFFKMHIITDEIEDSQNDFTFSVHDGCLEAVQCPSLMDFELISGLDTTTTGKIKRTLKFDKNGYMILYRFDIKDFTFIYNRAPYTLDNIYFSFENYGRPTSDKNIIKGWASSHAGESAQVNEQSLDWSFATSANDHEFNYIEKITKESASDLYEGITSFITKSVVSGEMTVNDLYYEKNVPCTYSPALNVNPISDADIDNISDKSLYCISEDDDYLYILEYIENLTAYGNILSGPATRVRRFNTNGICEYDAYYFFQNTLVNGPTQFYGYVEVTNNFVE
ncbi:MAG: leucine-rich repeat domain-containing protein [Bacilli bacterium]|nr:leucine-rich repeat domain-containing protein [Bacilli bacterium]